MNVEIKSMFYDPEDKFENSEQKNSEENEEENEKKIKILSEFVVNKIYAADIIITNISIANLDFNILYEIPSGALPIMISKS